MVPGGSGSRLYDMEKRQIEETEEDEKIEEQNKQNYQDEAPQDNQPEEKDEEDRVTINPLWLILLALLLLIESSSARGGTGFADCWILSEKSVRTLRSTSCTVMWQN